MSDRTALPHAPARPAPLPPLPAAAPGDEAPGPALYVSTTVFNLLGLDDVVPGGLRYVTSVDSFDGGHPHVFTPSSARARQPGGIEAANRFLLADPQVAEHVRGTGARDVLLLMFDERTEQLARALDLTLALPPAHLRDRIDSKLVTTRLADAAGVPTVPHVVARIGSYEDLLRAADGLGPDLVVQQAYGDSGSTTYFVSDEHDFARHAAGIVGQGEVRVMRRICCRQLTVEGVVTPTSTIAGPLQTELVGVPELTPFPGGWCGNEVVADDETGRVGRELRSRAADLVRRTGEALRAEGYTGCFGVDLLHDLDDGSLYLGEINPRITGAAPLTTRACLDAGTMPLLAVHLAHARRTVAPPVPPEVEESLRALAEDGPRVTWSQLVVEHLGPDALEVRTAPVSGVYALDADGRAVLRRAALDPADAAEGEAFVLRTVERGHRAPAGQSLVRLMLRGRVMDDDYRLTARARVWIDAVRRLVDPAGTGTDLRAATDDPARAVPA